MHCYKRIASCASALILGAAAVVVSVNFTAESQTVAWSVPGARGIARTLLKTPGAADPVLLDRIVLGPFGVYVAEVR